MKLKKTAVLRLLPVYFLLVLLIFYSVYSGVIRNRTVSSVLDSLFQNYQSQKNAQEISEIIWGRPVLVAIPRLKISVGVVDGHYETDTQNWNVSFSKAHFATITDLPNNQFGHSLIYGHNSDSIFGRTKDLVKGDKLYLETDNNYLFEYEFEKDEVVDIKDTEVFDYQGQPKLTLITCIGLLDQKRRIMTFNFIKVLSKK